MRPRQRTGWDSGGPGRPVLASNLKEPAPKRAELLGAVEQSVQPCQRRLFGFARGRALQRLRTGFDDRADVTLSKRIQNEDTQA